MSRLSLQQYFLVLREMKWDCIHIYKYMSREIREWKASERWGSLAGRNNAVTPIVHRPHPKVCLDVIHVSQWVCVISTVSAQGLNLPDFFAAFMHLWLTEPMNGPGEDEGEDIYFASSLTAGQYCSASQDDANIWIFISLLSISAVALTKQSNISTTAAVRYKLQFLSRVVIAGQSVLDKAVTRMQWWSQCVIENNGKQIVVHFVLLICTITGLCCFHSPLVLSSVFTSPALECVQLNVKTSLSSSLCQSVCPPPCGPTLIALPALPCVCMNIGSVNEMGLATLLVSQPNVSVIMAITTCHGYVRQLAVSPGPRTCKSTHTDTLTAVLRVYISFPGIVNEPGELPSHNKGTRHLYCTKAFISASTMSVCGFAHAIPLILLLFSSVWR